MRDIIRNKISIHFIVPPIPPNIPWKIFPIPVEVSFIAVPKACMILEAAVPKLVTTFSSKFPTPFNTPCKAEPTAFMMVLPPLASDSMVVHRALPIPSKTLPSP